MSKLLNHRILLLATLVTFLISCNSEQTRPAEVVTDNSPSYFLPNTSEEIVEKYDNGQHKSSVYVDNETKEKVAEVEFHENGQLYIKKKFKDGEMDGEAWSYYKDGQPWSLNTFKNGVYHGKYKTWYENGQVNIDGQYVDGKEDGDWLIFYPTGQINTRGEYDMGDKTGVWTSYNEDGSLVREFDYSKKK